jgi:multiple sugar transport system permease protein
MSKAATPALGACRSFFGTRAFYGYLFAAPGLLAAAALILYPLLFGFYVSLTEWNWASGQSSHMTFIGMRNYIDIIYDKLFWNALANTFYFSIIALILEMLIGTVSALLLNSIRIGSAVFRTILIFPLMISDIVAAIMWKMLLDPSLGFVNYLLSLVGIPRIDWLTNVHLVIPAIALMDGWWQTGVITLIVLAGLQSLPDEPREIARVDGATRWQIFVNVTLPAMSPFLWTAAIFRVIDLLRVFAIVWGTTGGGPDRASQVAQHYIYAQGIGGYLHIGYATSLAIIFAAFICIVVVVLLVLPKEGNAE